ncbi:MAG: polyphosphate kinase 1 [Melioribacteraceae bacterium]|nr:polyphosphate kinase 1 [Melioribacteraceae bacterium]MCF8355352.1 polyphosphate kinase 1 [Melioribacteraceae bacterium]MCF8396412.1 polyphosphate kinase 1 [Melioribacteraceae bacterium]MCF8417854.1 polyphosphate kinase 1 [Melioribacteraceae bacterium]
MTKDDLKKYFEPQNFFNRDLSWLEFNRRVLEEALDENLPLLDRIKFVAIFFSNLDEFYMIRVSGLKEQIRAKVIEPTIDGLTPIQQLSRIEKEVQEMLDTLYDVWNKQLLPQLEENKIFIVDINDLSEAEQNHLSKYFYDEIYPVLTPLAFDPGRPFPYISNLSLSLAIFVKKPNGEKHFARVKIPSILPRLLRIDEIVKSPSVSTNGDVVAKYVWLGDLIKHNLPILFPGMEILRAHRFRITRDTDLEIQEDEADDLLELIEKNIKQRKFGSVVRLEVEKDMPDFMIDTLTENLQITKRDIHIIDGQLGLSDLMLLYDLPVHHLKEKSFHPVTPTLFEEEEQSIFALLRTQDVFLHHPYDSFNPVVDFIKAASDDPDVLAIKQTLYRVGANSPVVKCLIEAAERKKQVAVLVELKARFDEENNIYWARELEKAGVHVVYGMVGLKTHAKMTLVVRKEIDGVKRYVHLATGNYNPSTAKLYTDIGFFTSDEDICADVSEVFNYLTGYSVQKNYRKLFVSPINTRDKLLEFIEREIKNVKKGRKGHLIFKLNSLVDATVIAALYEASNNGVRIDLIVRGICCLVPQKPGLSDNIYLRSIVGRFLEHSRAYYFYNNDNEEIYLSSADLMPRNLDRRIEVTFPIENKKIRDKIKRTLLDISLLDNQKSRICLPTGKYVFNRPVVTQDKINLQEWLMENTSPGILNIVQRKLKK